jgi:hypothetical protein
MRTSLLSSFLSVKFDSGVWFGKIRNGFSFLSNSSLFSSSTNWMILFSASKAFSSDMKNFLLKARKLPSS